MGKWEILGSDLRAEKKEETENIAEGERDQTLELEEESER